MVSLKSRRLTAAILLARFFLSHSFSSRRRQLLMQYVCARENICVRGIYREQFLWPPMQREFRPYFRASESVRCDNLSLQRVIIYAREHCSRQVETQKAVRLIASTTVANRYMVVYFERYKLLCKHRFMCDQ